MSRRSWFSWLSVAVTLCACAAMQGVPPVAKTDLAPGGMLRAAINFGNPILASRAGGELKGLSVDLSRELAARLGVPLRFVTYESAGQVVFAAPSQAWDVAFVAIDPLRGRDMLQTNPYVIIEGAYLVAADSPIRRNEDVDGAGVRIAVGKGSAYDLYLTRTIRHAQIVRAPTGNEAIAMFESDKLEVAAGVKLPLLRYAQSRPDLRVMDGRFMVIEQAMGVPKGRTLAVSYLRGMIEELKASGFVADALARSGQRDALVAPAS